MAYMANKQFETLGKMWTELRDNNGKLSFETFEEFSQLMREIQADKDKLNEKTRKYIAEKRKDNKNYARTNTEVVTENIKINYCGGKQQDRMIKNGWRLILAEHNESPTEIYNRLIEKGYKQVKVYYNTTQIRGLHKYFAFVK